MATPDFTIDLGNGIHLDSSGALTFYPPDGKAAFALSAPLPIQSGSLQQAFSGFKTIIPKLDDMLKDPGIIDQFNSIGIVDDVMQAFGKVAQIAETLASVVPIVNIAVSLLSVLTSFSSGSSMRDVVDEICGRITAELDAKARNDLLTFTGGCTSVFATGLTKLDDFRNQISKPKAYNLPGEREAKLKEVSDFVTNVQVSLTNALTNPWGFPFHSEDYWDWSYLVPPKRNPADLYMVPSPGARIPAEFPGDLPFDHRLMVPVVSFGIQTYLTMIKTVSPEHRTTGHFSAALQDMAGKLSSLLDNMRKHTLARTIYQTGVPEFKAGPRQFFILAVGALDLRNDTDEYFQTEGRQTAGAAPSIWDRVGNLNRMWAPPAGVDIRGPHRDIDGDSWWEISPAAIDLANQQSEQNYAEVLARSGYFTLAQLEALMRHLSTEPDSSETVTARSEVWRKPMPASPVTVVDSTILFSDPIEATASREPQQCDAYIFLTTQPLLHTETIGYRLRWLTLPEGRTETPFDRYVWTRYTTDDGGRNWRLEVNENPTLLLDPIHPTDPVGPNNRLFMDGPSPQQAIQQQGTVHLTADTFDWYVAVPNDPIRVARFLRPDLPPFEPSDQLAPGSGHSQHGGPGLITGGATEIRAHVTPDEVGLPGIGWQSGDQTWKGEKREWQRTQIELSYRLNWLEDRLSISITTRPQDRNYLIYLVVEEYLAHTQQWLRTPIPIRVVGQLTYVPQSFFDAEAAARKNASDILGNIERNYSVSRQPGPSDPVTNWVRPGTLESPEAMREYVSLVEQHAPGLVEQAVAEVSRQRGRR